jgi:selenobiotic family peptide radical SAM maturase
MTDRKKVNRRLFSRVYPKVGRFIPEDKWLELIGSTEDIRSFPDILRVKTAELQLKEYLGELARLELAVYNQGNKSTRIEQHTQKITINPSVQLFENTWKYLSRQITGTPADPEPEKGAESVIIWTDPLSRNLRIRPATHEDLLVLKMALEGLSSRDVARQGEIHIGAVETAVINALNDGIITGPEPLIKRNFIPDRDAALDPSFFAARIFTLQWHVTQACDLHCRHCYDRSHYKSLSLQQEIAILDDFAEFCASHNVHGQVTFSGGNPLLHADFEKLYNGAAERGFTIAILGNPATREQIERLNAIQPLAFYQVSLEGLEEHNDYMRGEGHFKKVLTFLDLLRELGVYSMVMLTLTKENIEQVLKLSEILRDRADLFTFNRLSLVGEGAKLLAVDPESYPTFLRNYSEAVSSNPCLGLKDNLLNIIYNEQQAPLFGGCTGYGCGAAFNFLAVLSDGTVHACRKFPSRLGSLVDQSLSEIYHSVNAGRYRKGAEECSSCMLNAVCRGCLAVTHSLGLDIFREKDPYCFKKD